MNPFKKFLFVLCLLSLIILIFYFSNSQNNFTDEKKIHWLKQNSIEVRSLSAGDEDFSDLQKLKSLIGNSKIVMLGEQTHGDGTTFEAKVRLVKFLHQEMGFDVLAFESGLFDMHKVWQSVQQGREPLTSVQEGMYGMWSKADAVKPLIDYIFQNRNSKRPLELAGFDCQFTGKPATRSFINDLKKFLSVNHISQIHRGNEESFWQMLNDLVNSNYYNELVPIPDEVEKNNLIAGIDTLSKAIENLQDDPDKLFWLQNIESIKNSISLQFEIEPNSQIDENVLRHLNIRDAQMARNLSWMTKKYYPNKKIIVWAATAHIMRNRHEADPEYKWATMGHHLSNEIGHQTYSIGFIAYQGTWGLLHQPDTAAFPISSDQSNEIELEELFHSTGLNNAILDFKMLPEDSWLRNPIFSRPLGHQSIKSNWTRHLDAVFFTDTMKPATKAAP